MIETHILVVDDEEDIRTVIKIPLEMKGYRIGEAQTGAEAIDYVRNNTDVDLIIMDIMMPGLSGVDACAKLREFCNAPILFLTALTGDTDKRNAYSSGGDDFLGKPFLQSELMLKVESLLRRYRVYKGKSASLSSDIHVDAATRTIKRGDETLTLTDTEYDIMKYLLDNRGKTVSTCEIYENVWHEKYLSTGANTVMVHILNLRKKVEKDLSAPVIIKTVWGKGYRID